MEHMRWSRASLIISVAALGCGFALPTRADEEEAKRAGPYYGLKYRLIGPAAGGRVARVAGVPGDPRTYWAATAAGGVWKSVNGGLEWKPVFDDQPVSSIGSIAVSPSDPNVVYVGSGEANIRGNVGEGNGIYRSTDAGKTWNHVWTAEGQIGTMAVHPTNPDIAYAAVLGSPFGPSETRGVLRTTDGGQTWKIVLHVDQDTGASDVCLDPSNPRIVFAGTWQARRTPWSMTSGGPGAGLWMSRDAGDTWKRLEKEGLPLGTWGKVGVAVAGADSRRVYALIEAEEGGLFRSDDGGEKWTRVNASRGLRQRAWYYSTLTIDPANPNVVWFPEVGMLKSLDAGHTVRSVKGGGWDYHDIWIDPKDPRRMVVGSDAGVSISIDGGETWNRPPLPIAQFYHLSVDTRVPYRVMGSLQDRGTASGPSNSLSAAGLLLSDWHTVGGGEAGHVFADPTDPDIVWAGEYLGYISRWNGRLRQAAHVGAYPESGSGHGSGDMHYRFQWTAPILISPHDHNVVYHAGNVLFRTNDGGQTWKAISPDLTRDDTTKQKWSGGPITGDNTGVEFYCTIFAVAESPVQKGVIWAGTDDGLVHVTRDGGTKWDRVTPPDLPEWATVSSIEASRWDAGTAYVVADAHRLDDETPYLWKTADFGKSWTRLGRDLDPEVYLHVVREDKKQRGMLYLGAERGVLVSRDDGATWESLRLNMPTVSVVDLATTDNDLVVGTLGRSAWILDDLTPVRETTPSLKEAAAHLFPPIPAIRWHYEPRWGVFGSPDGKCDNPPRGLHLTYHLSKKPDKPITIEILDAHGRVIRTLKSEIEPPYTSPDHPDWDPTEELKPALTTEAGFNRAAWDLSLQPARWEVGSRLDGSPASGPWAPPGDYSVRLQVGDQVLTQPARVEPDPRSKTPPADVSAQFAYQGELQDCLVRAADLITAVKSVRAQIVEQRARLAPIGEMEAACDRTLEKLAAIERELHDPKSEVDYDVLAGRDGGAKAAAKLNWLAGGAASHEGPPTQGMVDVAERVKKTITDQEAAFKRVILEDVSALNEAARQSQLPLIKPPDLNPTGK
jgi:photosystem II stability/assembly factor-like uncharacterized protein